MKYWSSYSSEHSANLVMIGSFKEVHDAEEAKRLIDGIVVEVSKEPSTYSFENTTPEKRFSDSIYQFLSKAQIYSLHPGELGQFELDVHVEQLGNRLRISTDEIDVSAYLKLLIDKGARVEIFSAHEHPEVGKAASDKESAS